MTPCDNKSQCHEPYIISQDRNAMRVICQHCRHIYIIRKRPAEDVPENRAYSKVFKKDVLQGNDNLFYKYHPQHMQS